MMKFLFFVFSIMLFGSAYAQTSMQPIVTASWHQSSPFNDDCPDGSAAGCGAIAVAQILHYYQKPASGFGHAVYGDVDVDFSNRSIDWQSIRESYSGNNSVTEKEAVASLVYQVGAAMKMKYGSSSSPHNYPSMMWGLQHYLHISPKSRYRHRKYYSTAEWIEMLNEELESGHPVFYRGDHTSPGQLVGHMFVIDGRDSEGKYHVNFGHADKNQDKFLNLNVINQSDGGWPGYNVCYHHRQAMVTDFYPVDNLTDEYYDNSALVLNSPIVLNNQPDASKIEATGRVQAAYQVRFVSFTGGTCQYSLGFFQQGALVEVSETIRDASFSDGGYAINVNRSFLLPGNLPDGDYEMSIISRDGVESPWVKGWDNAPNKVPVRIKEGVYIFTLPNWHNHETNLYLEKASIEDIHDERTGGQLLQMTVCNTSDNNFEDSLRIVVSANGRVYQYAMNTSIYEGQKITYRIAVKDSDIDLSQGYQAEAFYRENISGLWHQLSSTPAGIQSQNRGNNVGICIYNLNGLLVKYIPLGEINDTYNGILLDLPQGMYIVKDKNGTRKYTRR